MTPHGPAAKPRTDGWVWLWTLVLTASLAWSIFWLIFTVVSDPCAYAQCTLSLAVAIWWFYPQFIAALPSVIGIVTLIRYAARGNQGLPFVGLAIFLVNVVTSVTLIIYLLTLPVSFR